MQGSHADNLLFECIRAQNCSEARFRLPIPQAGKESETGNVAGTKLLNNVNIGPSIIVSAHTAVLTIARLLGRQIAREQFERAASANDNAPVREAGDRQER